MLILAVVLLVVALKWKSMSGLAVAFASSVFTLEITEWSTQRRQKQENAAKFQGWLKGVAAELAYIEGVIGEFNQSAEFSANVFTKRMNSDLLGKARLVLFDYDEDIHFLGCLTAAYGDDPATCGPVGDRLFRNAEKMSAADLEMLAQMAEQFAKRNEQGKKGEP
jgi:hypothetical protein